MSISMTSKLMSWTFFWNTVCRRAHRVCMHAHNNGIIVTAQRASQEEQNDTNISSVAPSSEEL